MTNFNFAKSEGYDLKVLALPANPGKKNPIPLQTLPIKSKKIFNFRNFNLTHTGFELPEYNLYEISSAEDVDGIVRRAIQKKRALGDKEGWSLKGKNNGTIAYIKRRLQQIAIASNIPHKLLIKDTFGDLIRYHNAFWYLQRNEKNSGGKIRKVRTYRGEKDLKPIAAVFRIAPETIRIKFDDYGNPKQYLQEMPDGRRQEYDADNIIHFVFNRRAGFAFAAPGMLVGIDDIRALRRIEENVELLVEQYLFPLFVMYIGTDDWPAEEYEDGSTEVDLWTAKINAIPSSGGIAVTHRHKFDTLGFDKVIPIEKYLEHFKKRAYTAMGVSNLDMGEGEGMNRSTADNASKILIEDVKDYQKEFEYQINFYFINQLLLENYDMNVLDDENIVELEYNEIDLENMMKLENHYWLGYSSSGVTEDEMRLKTKMPIIDSEEERSKLFLYTYEQPKIEMEAAAAVKINASKPAASSSSTSSLRSRENPTNQHGTSLGPTHRKSSMAGQKNKIGMIIRDLDKNDPDLFKMRLINWIYTLDFAKQHSDISDTIFSFIDETVDDAYLNLSDGTDPHLISDIITEKVCSFIDIWSDSVE